MQLRNCDFLKDLNLQEGGLLLAVQVAGETCALLTRERLESLRLTEDEATVLLILDRRKEKEMMQSEIASLLGLNRNLIVKVLDSLERRKLLVRIRDATNRRKNKVVITERGRSRADDVASALRAASFRAFGRHLKLTEERDLRSVLLNIAHDCKSGTPNQAEENAQDSDGLQVIAKQR